MKTIGTMFAAAVVVVVSGDSLRAEHHHLVFALSAAQEVQDPAVVSPATGMGTVILDTDLATDNLFWDISFSGLLGSVNAAHFHGPAAAGTNAGILLNIGQISGLTSPMTGSATITDLQEAQILAGLWYVNIHTSSFGDGELRGQVPEPGTLALLALGALGVFAAKHSGQRKRQACLPERTNDESHGQGSLVDGVA